MVLYNAITQSCYECISKFSYLILNDLWRNIKHNAWKRRNVFEQFDMWKYSLVQSSAKILFFVGSQLEVEKTYGAEERKDVSKHSSICKPLFSSWSLHSNSSSS